MKCQNCSFPIWHTLHGLEICKPCAIKMKYCSDDTPDNRKCPVCNKVAPIETSFKKAEIDLGQAKQVMTYCEECRSVFFPEIKDYRGLTKFNVAFDKVIRNTQRRLRRGQREGQNRSGMGVQLFR